MAMCELGADLAARRAKSYLPAHVAPFFVSLCIKAPVQMSALAADARLCVRESVVCQHGVRAATHDDPQQPPRGACLC